MLAETNHLFSPNAGVPECCMAWWETRMFVYMRKVKKFNQLMNETLVS